MKKLLHTTAVVVLTTGATFFGVLLGDRKPPYDHDFGTISPMNPPEQSQVTVDWKMRNPPDRVCEGWVQREIWQGVGVNSTLACIYDKQPAIKRDQLMSTRDDGKPNTLERSFNLCDKLVAGPARYRAFTCYQCNPLQQLVPNLLSICVYTPDILFTVTPKKSAIFFPRSITVPTNSSAAR